MYSLLLSDYQDTDARKTLIKEESKLIAVFGIFELSRIRCLHPNKRFFTSIFLHKWKGFDGDFVGGIISVVTEKFEFAYRNETINLKLS